MLKITIERLPFRTRIIHCIAKYVPSWLKSKPKYSTMQVLVKRRWGHLCPLQQVKYLIDYKESLAYSTIAYNIYVNPSLLQEEWEKYVSKYFKR